MTHSFTHGLKYSCIPVVVYACPLEITRLEDFYGTLRFSDPEKRSDFVSILEVPGALPFFSPPS